MGIYTRPNLTVNAPVAKGLAQMAYPANDFKMARLEAGEPTDQHQQQQPHTPYQFQAETWREAEIATSLRQHRTDGPVINKDMPPYPRWSTLGTRGLLACFEMAALIYAVQFFVKWRTDQEFRQEAGAYGLAAATVGFLSLSYVFVSYYLV